MTGPQQLTGQVYGTRHGGTDTDLFPTTTALVRRVRTIRHLVQEKDRVISPVPGSLTLTDVQTSPKWFNQGRRAAAADPPWSQDGVLIDLATNQEQVGAGQDFEALV